MDDLVFTGVPMLFDDMAALPPGLASSIGFGEVILAPPGGGAALTVSSIIPTANLVRLLMSDTPVLVGDGLLPSKWVLSSTGNPNIPVISVSVVGDEIRLVTGEHKNGATYDISFPQGLTIIQVADGTLFAGPFTQSYTGVGTSPSFVNVISVDARTFRVVYSEQVNESDAMTAANYGIAGPLSVVATKVTKLSEVMYEVETTEQQRGGSYTVTISNVRDLAGNVIA